MAENKGLITEQQAEHVRDLLTKINGDEQRIEDAKRQIETWEEEIVEWKREIDEIVQDADPDHPFNKGFLIGVGIVARPSTAANLPSMMPTNREKIIACLRNHPEGATFDQVAEETGIPENSLSSDLSGRDVMGIMKHGRGRSATYTLKSRLGR